ncbi:oxygenase MpaB family protein [Ornithinicoccus hortensis]|uniref:Uncharacterized protein (DUF2236 family) n=1 Tax=Ornithinicoccus hortensis TaxID=82346 RepID=A0A542YMZ9_9MICO|nr:oxygenase MpaB family protein [Ornithinicoccus hortensis]TQL49478.1 uncharacterized protein (DUF2236 family) [Ornithinicoccus hortensis]
MPILAVQRRAGAALRAKVAGDDAAEQARLIWGVRGERWFGVDDAIWQVHRDASMFVGGIAALLVQSLQPMAMAGVAGHSGYKSDPWGRLQRTSRYLAVTTYGVVPDAEDVIDRVRSVHARVRGKDERGRPYRADDPHLLTWVHLAEVRCFLDAHQAFGAQPLPPDRADEYVEQTGRVAARLGVPDPPATVADLQTRLSAYRPELEATPAARDAARFLLLHPPLSFAARPGYGMLAAGALSLLEPWELAELGVRLPVGLTRGVGRPVGKVAARTVRWALSGVDDERVPPPSPESGSPDAGPSDTRPPDAGPSQPGV